MGIDQAFAWYAGARWSGDVGCMPQRTEYVIIMLVSVVPLLAVIAVAWLVFRILRGR